MAKMKLSISGPNGKVQNLEVEGPRAQQFIGKKMGDILDGTFINLPNLKLQITGGSDHDGFPMRRDVHGGVRKKIMISGGTGFKTKIRGKRRRKRVCGNVITENIVQVDTKIISS